MSVYDKKYVALKYKLKNPPTMSHVVNSSHLYSIMKDTHREALDYIELLEKEIDCLR